MKKSKEVFTKVSLEKDEVFFILKKTKKRNGSLPSGGTLAASLVGRRPCIELVAISLREMATSPTLLGDASSFQRALLRRSCYLQPGDQEELPPAREAFEISPAKQNQLALARFSQKTPLDSNRKAITRFLANHFSLKIKSCSLLIF